MNGLDGRHRDKNGEIEKKHGNTKIKNLKPVYPQFKGIHGDTTLGTVERRLKVKSLDEVLKKLSKPNNYS
jgi:hypothetical protein